MLTPPRASSCACIGQKGADPLPFHSLEDLKAIAEEAGRQGIVQEGIVAGAVEFHERDVREIMTPRPRVAALRAEATLAEAVQSIRETGHSRYPVFEGEVDNVLGFVYARDVYDAALAGAETGLGGLVRPALSVPAGKRATELLEQMRTGGVHLALVVDEHGSLEGLVTLEDLLEVIVGQIHDEHRVPMPLVKDLGDGRFEVDGSLPIQSSTPTSGSSCPSRRATSRWPGSCSSASATPAPARACGWSPTGSPSSPSRGGGSHASSSSRKPRGRASSGRLSGGSSAEPAGRESPGPPEQRLESLSRLQEALARAVRPWSCWIDPITVRPEPSTYRPRRARASRPRPSAQEPGRRGAGGVAARLALGGPLEGQPGHVLVYVRLGRRPLPAAASLWRRRRAPGSGEPRQRERSAEAPGTPSRPPAWSLPPSAAW